MRNFFLSVCVLIGVFVVHVNSRATTPSDSVWSIPLAVSILQEGNTELGEFAVDAHRDDYRLDWLASGVYYHFPLGSSLLALPFVWGSERFAQPWFGIDDLPAYLRQNPVSEVSGRIERFISSWFVALTAMVIWAIGRRQLGVGRSLVLVFVFAFCTPAWSTASRALWQHSASMLMLALTLWLLLRAEDAAPYATLAALPLAMAYLIRPTNSLSILVLTIFVLLSYPRQFLYFCGVGLLVAVPFFSYNFAIYGVPFSDYYRPARLGLQSGFGQALAANLISPGRGLFVWSPILLFALPAMGRTFRPIKNSKLPASRRVLDWALIAILVLHWLTVSSFQHWWGGWTIGPRFFTDMMPYFVYFLIPVVQGFGWMLRGALDGVAQTFREGTAPSRKGVGALPSGKVQFLPGRWETRDLARIALFAVALAFSSFVHFHSAMHFNVFRWNRIPLNVDQYPQRVWDWNDIPFLRGLGPIMLLIQPQASAGQAQIALEITNQDSHLIHLTVKLPANFQFEETPLFQQQFQILEKTPDYTLARTQQSFAMNSTRTLPLRHTSSPTQTQCESPPIEIIATVADLWFARRSAVIIPVCQVDRQRDTLVEWLAAK